MVQKNSAFPSPSLASDEQEAFAGAVIGTKGLRLDEIGFDGPAHMRDGQNLRGTNKRSF